MIKLYTYPASSNSRKVRVVLWKKVWSSSASRSISPRESEKSGVPQDSPLRYGTGFRR